MRLRPTAIVLTLAAAGAGTAQAQVVDSSGWVMIMSTITHTDPLSMMLDDRMAQDAARARRTGRQLPPESASRQAAPADAAALRYIPSIARRSANLATFVQKTRAADPAGSADLQKLFAQGDFIERIGALVAPHGLHIDNVADAYTLWWLTAWAAVHGNNDTPDPAILAAVRRQAASAVAATGGIASASDAKKQELAEALWVQSALIDATVEQAKRDPARLRAVGNAVRKGAQGMGLDLDRLDLTPGGFVLARGG
ncbi:DUF6683 family protein [Sphingomonas azotifigens]|uniref:DUF6683 family protein n=1 Tax=Sphingomonas azotifigens TaxID=330920 RepID=UPI000A037E56|nr:DUF6683 family protein [Sphingomonas azotifigens]